MGNKRLKSVTIGLIAITISAFAAKDKHYVGGDISLLPTYEEAGSVYKNADGEVISLLPFLDKVGLNAMRVRLFVDPVNFLAAHKDEEVNDPNACQNLNYIIPLCKEITEKGFDLMLDFHYSDTWADPSKQWIPARWTGLNESQLLDSVYSYTKNSLIALKANGVIPKFIQAGNEISYGMLWAPYGEKDDGANHVWKDSPEEGWERFANLLIRAIKACKEECPDSKIIIHNERVEDPGYLIYYYNKLNTLKVDYDIIGLSYYPYWHGKIGVLDTALSFLEDNFPTKELMVVETGYSYRWPEGDQTIPLDYPLTEDGQNEYAEELVKVLESHENATGLFWWWLEYNAYQGGLTGWYNASLFDNETGKAQKALYTIATYATEYNAVERLEEENKENKHWYDLLGREIARPTQPGVYIHQGKVVYIIK